MMRDCTDMQLHLPVYADGELADDLRPAAEQHLAECEKCRVQVQRWQALRRGVQRAVASEALPPGLEQRLRQRLRAETRTADHRVIKLWGSALAAAATIALLAWLYLPGTGEPGATAAAATPVDAGDFAAIHLKCAVANRHDPQHRRGTQPHTTALLLAEQVGYEPLVADLSASGFILDGVCRCFPRDDVKVVHAYYRSAGPQVRVVSLFTTNRGVELKACSHCRGTCVHGHAPRSYEVATAGRVSVLKWDEPGHSCALCGQMGHEELIDLAGSAVFARSLRALPAYAWGSDR
jgi:anti-sigma factor (TIGR02949 family)